MTFAFNAVLFPLIMRIVSLLPGYKRSNSKGNIKDHLLLS